MLKAQIEAVIALGLVRLNAYNDRVMKEAGCSQEDIAALKAQNDALLQSNVELFYRLMTDGS